jgi:hypothetical protein
MSFANPAALWLLLSVPPLLALYFLKARRRRVRVPSLLPWQSFVRNQKQARPWDRFRRHDLLWLQLLALGLLTLALAGPQVPGRKLLGRSVVWVVDGSASMAAAAPAPSRFERAQSLVLGEVGQLGAADEGMLVLAGPEPRVAASFTRDKDQLRSAVRAMRPTQAAARLAPAMDLAAALARSRPERTLVVVTDGSDRGLATAVERHRATRVEIVGRPAPNVAITALDLRRSPAVDLESELFVTLRRLGGEPGPVALELTLDGNLLATESVELPADRPIAKVWRGLGGADSKGGLLRLRLDSGDAFPLDDEAVAWLRPPQRRRVRCEGCTVLTARALASDPRFVVELGGDAAGASAADLVVYEDVLLPERPPAPFLALGATGPAGPGAEPPLVEWPRVSSWRRAHPVLRWVDPSGIHVRRARPPQGGRYEPLIESDRGPLLTTAVLGGQRGVLLHMRPLDSDLPLRVAWPLLLLNASGWLSGEEQRAQGESLATGEPLLREGWGADGETVELLRPDGGALAVPVREGVARFGSLERAGIYQLRGPGGRQERVTANLVSETESDLAVFAPPEPSAGAGAAGAALASVPGRVPLLRPVLLGLCLLLLGEWWLWTRKYRE